MTKMQMLESTIEFQEKRIKQANEFIIDIAKLLNINEDIGFDGITLSIEDFEKAIKQINKNDFIPDVSVSLPELITDYLSGNDYKPEYDKDMDKIIKLLNIKFSHDDVGELYWYYESNEH